MRIGRLRALALLLLVVPFWLYAAYQLAQLAKLSG